MHSTLSGSAEEMTAGRYYSSVRKSFIFCLVSGFSGKGKKHAGSKGPSISSQVIIQVSVRGSFASVCRRVGFFFSRKKRKNCESGSGKRRKNRRDEKRPSPSTSQTKRWKTGRNI